MSRNEARGGIVLARLGCLVRGQEKQGVQANLIPTKIEKEEEHGKD
jgi:hypothetical protein